MSLTDYTKQSQIVQNYFTKCAQLVAHARLPSEELKQSRQSTNKWFNLELDELDFLQEALAPWKRVSPEELPPPLVVECYLDPSKLRPGQTVVCGDKRTMTNSEIVLERWVVDCRAPTASDGSMPDQDLPVLYKRAIVSMRALYTVLHMLPTWQLHQRLQRQKLISMPLKLGIRIHNGTQNISSRGRVGLSKTPDGKKSALQQFKVQPLETSIGVLHCSVTYRSDVHFIVEDVEQVVAQRFMDLDRPSATAATTGGDTSTLSISPVPMRSNSSTSLRTSSPKPVLSFTRPFKSQDESVTGSIPRSVGTPSSHNIAGSVSSIVSSSSRFSSSFASRPARGSTGSQGGMSSPAGMHAGASSQAGIAMQSGMGLQSAIGVSTSLGSQGGLSVLGQGTADNIGDFVKFVEETRKEFGQQHPGGSDVDTSLARFQRMRTQLSDSVLHRSTSTGPPSITSIEQQDETVRPRRRSTGPRSRLGFYDDKDDGEKEDDDLLFTLSDVHI